MRSSGSAACRRPRVTDLAATPGIKMKLIDHAQYVDAMNKKYGPLYVKATIAPGSYSGQDKPYANIDVWNILVVPDKMSDKMAYDIVKTLFEHKPELVAVHKEAENIDLKNQIRSQHPCRSIPARRSISKNTASRFNEPGGAGAEPSDAAVTDERLRKAAEFVEEEEGAVSRFRGWLGTFTTAALVVMIAVPPVRGARDRARAGVAAGSRRLRARPRVPAVPDSGRYRNRLMWWDVVCARCRRRDHRLPAAGGDEFWDRNTTPSTPTSLRRRVRAARARGVPAHVGMDHHDRRSELHRLRIRRPVAPGAVGASRLRRVEPHRASCTRRSKAFSARRSTCRRR